MEREIKKEFGEFFKNRRLALGYTLRQFCLEKGLDPSNISKLERGKMSPPDKHEKLEEYARYLELKEGSAEWYEFFDLAYVAQGKIPEEVMNDKEVVEKLPILFRTVRGQRVTDAQIKALIRLIKRA